MIPSLGALPIALIHAEVPELKAILCVTLNTVVNTTLFAADAGLIAVITNFVVIDGRIRRVIDWTSIQARVTRWLIQRRQEPVSWESARILLPALRATTFSLFTL